MSLYQLLVSSGQTNELWTEKPTAERIAYCPAFSYSQGETQTKFLEGIFKQSVILW